MSGCIIKVIQVVRQKMYFLARFFVFYQVNLASAELLLVVEIIANRTVALREERVIWVEVDVGETQFFLTSLLYFS